MIQYRYSKKQLSQDQVQILALPFEGTVLRQVI